MRSFALFIGLIFSLAAQAQEAFLTVRSNPPGCWVRVDSALVGKTPLEKLAVAPGEHVIQVYPPYAGIWNLSDYNFVRNLSAGDTTQIVVYFDQPVLINSIPPGANVFVNKRYLGDTPLYLNLAQHAGKTVRIEKDGYQPFQFVLSGKAPLLIRLQSLEGVYASQEQGKPQLLGLFPRSRAKAKFSLLALAVASHWTAFYFKNKADDAFDKYQQTADPVLMDRYLRQTRKYDRLSDITLGLSYVSLAGLIYLVIWH